MAFALIAGLDVTAWIASGRMLFGDCMSAPATVWLGVSEVTVSHDFQMRQKLSKSTVDEYAELILTAQSLWPFASPCTVYRVKDELILVDGFHRVAAVTQAGEDQIEAVVIDGSKTDALKAALSANITHGLRRSNDDKRRAVTIALADSGLAKWSDSKLAQLCGVSHPFVGQVRAELVTVTGSAQQKDCIRNGVHIGSDGKSRPANKASQITQREKIVAAVVACEGSSDREIAKMIGCDGKTVASVRRELESSSVAVAESDPDEDMCDEDEPVDLLDMFVAIQQEIRILMAQIPISDRQSMWRQVVEKLNSEDVLAWK